MKPAKDFKLEHEKYNFVDIPCVKTTITLHGKRIANLFMTEDGKFLGLDLHDPQEPTTMITIYPAKIA